MKEGTKNLLMIGGVVVLGYYLLNKSKKKKTSIVNVIKTDVSDVEKVGEFYYQLFLMILL